MTNRAFTKFRNNKLLTVEILLLIGISLVLRLAELGYSNFQGDELNALCRYTDFKSPLQFLAYLLGQPKGPVQYLITCAYSLLDPSFSSELAIRLPFAIANLAALACYFLLVRRLFSLQVAIYASFLFAVNGIFIAFARIVQYQSFVILGGVAALLSLSLALQYEKWRVPGIYLSFLLAAMALLAHFDAAFFLPPMAVLVLHGWWRLRNRPGFARLRLHLIAAAALFAFLVLAFYFPYALHLGPNQTNHWENRFAGVSTNILRLYQFYNPGPFLWIGLGLVILGLTRIRNTLDWQVTLAWLMPPLIFMTLIFKDSRTHAYTYILPMFIIAGIGIDTLIGWLNRLLGEKSSRAAIAAVLAVFMVLSYTSYSIFIDQEPEYPWYPKRVLGMQLEGGRLTGTFGFPYLREWRQIGEWFQELPQGETPVVVTNEKFQFVTFYLPSNVRNMYKYSKKGVPEEIQAPDGLYILIIPRAQSWMDQLWGLSLDGWHEKFVPRKDFTNEEGKVVASVYFLTQEQIQNEFSR
jgi:4-amino-4-deoxy-L-arabinose transferase-like glycosyltransferase